MPRPSTRARKAIAAGGNFGERLRALRKAQGKTLNDVSAASGLSRAAVSKIERGEMSPTYASLLKVARGLETDVSLLISGRRPDEGGFDVTRAGKGTPHLADKRFPSRLLAPGLPHRMLHAFVTEVRPMPLEKYGPWDSHDSEDFLHVLEGTIVVHMEGREPIELKPGDSLQMDGRIKRAVVSRKGLASLLWVSVPFV